METEALATIEPQEEREIRTLTSALLDRVTLAQLAGVSFNGLRRLYDILGYPPQITTAEYKARYRRGGLAGRVVDVMPDATWRGGVELVEDEDPKVSTAFEESVEALAKRLHVWATMRRIDKMASLSTFGVLLIGAKGNLSEELPRGRKQEDVLYLSPYIGGGSPVASGGIGITNMLDAMCTVQSWVQDIEDERFGLPEFYQLRRTTFGTMALNAPVHWTRIIHIAENLLEDDVYGAPKLERTWNLLDDLDKVTGGGAEAFWLRVNKGMQIDFDKGTKAISEPEKAELRQQIEDYQHQISRILRTRGVTINELGSDVANFSLPADAIITQIAGSNAIPKRILTGSEMGELASSQDRENFRDQVNGRQSEYAAPFMVRPLFDRLIEYGYLPTPKQYDVKFAHIQTLTEDEKAKGAQSWASTNAAQKSPVFTSAQIRDHWYDMEPLTPEEIAGEQQVQAAGQPAAPGAVPQDGGGEDVLNQLLGGGGALAAPTAAPEGKPAAKKPSPFLKAAGGLGSGFQGHTTPGKPPAVDAAKGKATLFHATPEAAQHTAAGLASALVSRGFVKAKDGSYTDKQTGNSVSITVGRGNTVTVSVKKPEVDGASPATLSPADKAREAVFKKAHAKGDASAKGQLTKLYAKYKTAETHSYDSTQVNLTGELRDAILALGEAIPDEDLAENGRETTPHVTVKYGITDAGGIADLIANFGPVVLTLGSTGVFSVDDYDVVQVAVDSPDLERLNALIRAGCECVDTQPSYMPHATVAYVKKGLGVEWAGIELGGSMVANAIDFMPADDSGAVTLSLRAAGDKPGHEFHGNQWKSGVSPESSHPTHPLPDKPEHGDAVYSLNDQEEGDLDTHVSRKKDGSYYAAADSFDFEAKTAEDMRAKLKKYGAHYMEWERSRHAAGHGDAEMIRVLEAAIVAGNQDVVNKICGLPDQPRDEKGQFAEARAAIKEITSRATGGARRVVNIDHLTKMSDDDLTQLDTHYGVLAPSDPFGAGNAQKAVQSEIKDRKARSAEFDESKHPRDRGRFAPVQGGDAEHHASPSDAAFALSNGKSVTVAREDLRGVLNRVHKSGDTADLTRLTVEGTHVFSGGLNRTRASMPQIDKEHQQDFLDSIQKQGITVKAEAVPPSDLYPTQNEINAGLVGEKLARYDKGKDFRPIMVSNDDHVLDGHHRWAAMTAIDVESPSAHVKVPIIRLGASVGKSLKVMQAYMTEHKPSGKALKDLESVEAED